MAAIEVLQKHDKVSLCTCTSHRALLIVWPCGLRTNDAEFCHAQHDSRTAAARQQQGTHLDKALIAMSHALASICMHVIVCVEHWRSLEVLIICSRCISRRGVAPFVVRSVPAYMTEHLAGKVSSADTLPLLQQLRFCTPRSTDAPTYAESRKSSFEMQQALSSPPPPPPPLDCTQHDSNFALRSFHAMALAVSAHGASERVVTQPLHGAASTAL